MLISGLEGSILTGDPATVCVPYNLVLNERSSYNIAGYSLGRVTYWLSSSAATPRFNAQEYHDTQTLRSSRNDCPGGAKESSHYFNHRTISATSWLRLKRWISRKCLLSYFLMEQLTENVDLGAVICLNASKPHHSESETYLLK